VFGAEQAKDVGGTVRYRPCSLSSLSGVLVYAGVTLGLQLGAQSPLLAGAGSKERFSKQTYTYKQVGNCEVKADVYGLPGDEVRPAILWIHGGALIFSDRGSVTDHQLQRYLRAG
jgi:acetyl esterase/lipase